MNQNIQLGGADNKMLFRNFPECKNSMWYKLPKKKRQVQYGYVRYQPKKCNKYRASLRTKKTNKPLQVRRKSFINEYNFQNRDNRFKNAVQQQIKIRQEKVKSFKKRQDKIKLLIEEINDQIDDKKGIISSIRSLRRKSKEHYEHIDELLEDIKELKKKKVELNKEVKEIKALGGAKCHDEHTYDRFGRYSGTIYTCNGSGILDQLPKNQFSPLSPLWEGIQGIPPRSPLYPNRLFPNILY